MLILSCNTILKSQGFDWQYSSRMPTAYPNLFIGANTQITNFQNTTAINLFDNVCICTKFDTHQSTVNYNYGFASEYWASPYIALTASLNYTHSKLNLQQMGEALPLNDTTLLKTEFVMQSDLSYITLNLGAKYRLFGTHAHIGTTLGFGILSSNSIRIFEHVLSPAGYHFRNTNSDSIFYKSPELKNLYIVPRISLGYDISIIENWYLTPSVNVGIPIMQVIKTDTWNQWQYSFSLSIFRGIIY
ncbi:MAG: hypothetical protein NT007_04035 [Candidatus Kapabacteria bacterium]|nr:hypothetical protein [Candidatus Kapabacteria bacterium]